jgi:BirA family transcriptional regulator, biotin operon repressor / biotin---[acetyl-CoA-carboxylase] ligase
LAIRIFVSTAARVGVVTGWDRTWPPGWHVEHVAVTTSTNAVLLADAYVRPDRSVLAAGHQTQGRGRLDRRWEAPPDASLLASLLFHRVPADPGVVTRRVSVAAVDACRQLGRLDDVALKWPNDVLAGGAKLAGVLAQRHADGPLVVGIGVNVRAALLGAYDAVGDDVGARYRTELATLGRRVRVELPSGPALTGTATDVTVDGRLVVLDDSGSTHRLAVADVVHLRGA